MQISALSSDGTLAGRLDVPYADQTMGAFRWMGIEFTFKVPGAEVTEVLGMNNQNEMVGSTMFYGNYTAFHRSPKGKISPYMYPGSEQTTFNDINDNGVILGWQYTDMDNHGTFLLNKQGKAITFVVPGYENGNWYRINNKGQVMGTLYDYPGASGMVGAIVDGNQVEVFQYPGAQSTIAVDMNNKGDVLGEAWMPYDFEEDAQETVAFLRKKSGQIVPLDYQPSWPGYILEKVDGRPRLLKLDQVTGTSARALDDSGRAIIVCSALYTAKSDYGTAGVYKERTFAIRP